MSTSFLQKYVIVNENYPERLHLFVCLSVPLLLLEERIRIGYWYTYRNGTLSRRHRNT